MRLFFGLEPDPADARAIADWRDRQLPAAGRPVPMANFHITLAFLGELGERRLERLGQAVDNFVDGSTPAAVDLELEDIGYWPRPRICWLGPAAWAPQLDALATRLGELGAAEGGRRDRRSYRPHITLYRGLAAPPAAPLAPPGFHLHFDHFTLFESRQGRSGVSYHPIHSWALLSLPRFVGY